MILLRQPELRQRAAACLAGILPGLRATGRIVLTGKTLQDVLWLCDRLALYGSPPLRQDMFGLRRDLKDSSLVESLGVSVVPEAGD